MGPSRYVYRMKSAALHAVLITCILLPLFAAGVAGVPPVTARSAGEQPGARDRSFLLPNISIPARTPSAQDWYEQGFALTSEERYADAITVYEKALAANHSLLNAWYYLGDALFRSGRYQEALHAFGNATAIDPDFLDAYFYESLVYDRLGRVQEGKDALEKGLEAADRMKAGKAANTSPEAKGALPLPVPTGTPVLAAGMAALLRALLAWKKK